MDEQDLLNSVATTRGIRIAVRPEFVAARSDPARGMWFHAYHVTISNVGEEAANLRTRHWIITNANGLEHHVKGDGVVGEQPRLEPGESFQYTSACPLDTAFGTMHGTFQMETAGGESFDAEIAPFTLAEPGTVN